MASSLQFLRRFFAQPQVREFLLWCLPGLLAGFAIRAVLMAQLPYAIYHDDSGDLLLTANSWITQHHFEIHGKKTFLVPVLYLLLALLHIPILLAMPILQHLLGLVFIALVGLLCRLWFAHWRWFIIPITLLMAVDPALLWYEHLLMAETACVFSLVLVAVAGTLYALTQSRARFAFLCGALVLLAGSRPEGKLLFGFAFLLLALLHWRRWRLTWARFAILLTGALATHLATRSGQSGLLLYTSVARMTPTELKSAPGFDPFIAPIRSELRQRWETDRSFPLAPDRRVVAGAVQQYLKGLHPHAHIGHDEINEFCLKLARETCLKNFFQLPVYFYEKLRFTTREPTFGYLDRIWVFDRQKKAFHANSYLTGPEGISSRVTGADTTSDEAYSAFLQQHYRDLPWFNRLANSWTNTVNSIHLPDAVRVTEGHQAFLRGLPVLYLLGAIGLLLMMLRRGILQPFHIAWGLSLLGLFYVIILTANVRGRFRFEFEPFWYLYLGLIADSLAYWVFRRRAAPGAVAAPAPASSSAQPPAQSGRP